MPRYDPPTDAALHTSFRDLRVEITRRGWCQKSAYRIVLQLAVHLMTMTFGVTVLTMTSHPVAMAFGLIMATAGMMGVASNTHTSSHYATSDRRWINEALTFFGCSFVLGLSATYWWRKHGRHHSSPNVHGEDEDASFSPWFALTDLEVRTAKTSIKTYYAHVQRFLFPVALALNAPNMQKNGVVFLYKELVRCRGRDLHLLIDTAGLVGHVILNIVVPSIVWGGAEALMLYWARVTAFGYAMFAFFGPAHLPPEAAILEVAPKKRRLMFVLAATVNYRAGKVGRWLGSGLDHQIEHHLFPNISHLHYPAIRPVVESFCRENGLPYRQIGWAEGLHSALRVMRVPKVLLRAADVRMLGG